MVAKDFDESFRKHNDKTCSKHTDNSQLRWFDLGFSDFAVVEKWHTFRYTVGGILNSGLFWASDMQSDTLVTLDSGSKLQLAIGHHREGEPPTVHSALRCQHFRTLGFEFSHPMMSTKCPSVSPASGEKRKAIILEMKLKIFIQL